MEDTVSVGDVVAVLQPAEMLLRIAEEVEGYLVELGEDGRLVGLQSSELVDGVARALAPGGPRLLHGDPTAKAARPADAGRGPRCIEHGWPQPRPRTSCATPAGVADDPGGCPGSLPATPSSGVEPRGYRLLHRLPRFSDTIIERIVDRFVDLQQIMRASSAELEQVEGVGQARAHSVKDGLARLAEASIFERYQ